MHVDQKYNILLKINITRKTKTKNRKTTTFKLNDFKIWKNI